MLALGSHEERHGAALPLDTDARIATHVALGAAKRVGVRFLGVVRASYELPYIDTGHHQMLGELLNELKERLAKAKEIGVGGVVLVNAHGGNNVLREHIGKLQGETGIRLIFNCSIVEMEGPHAASGELSMAAAIGIADKSKLVEHIDFERYPEVGFVGLKETRKRYPWAEEHAREVEREGVRIDESSGKELLERAIADVVDDILELQAELRKSQLPGD